jgi:hypothetical protein
MPKSKPTETANFAAGPRVPGPGRPGAPVLCANPHPHPDPVLTLLEKRNDADRRATALDKLLDRNPEQDAAFEAADRECNKLEDRIARTKATTLSGVIAKLGLIDKTDCDSTLVQGAIADLRRFEKKASIARTPRR